MSALENPTVERVFPSGMWLVSDIIGGQYVKRRYDGTRREAVANFKAEFVDHYKVTV